MNQDLGQQKQKMDSARRGRKSLFLWFLILPILIGILMNVFSSARSGTQDWASVPLMIFLIFTLILCVTAEIGLCARVSEKKWLSIFSGVVLGIFFAALDVFLAFFIGCTLELTKL